MNEPDQARRRKAELFGLCALPLLALLGASVTLWGGSVEGRAVDADTGKPLTNAVAYGIWEGSLEKLTRTDENCAWAESARVDPQGKFRLPAWIKHDSGALFTSRLARHVFIYAPGYELKSVSSSDLPEVKVKPFVGTVDERFRRLFITPCVPADSEHRVAVVYRMMAEEMERSATTVYQRQAAETAREQATAARTNPSRPTTRSGSGYLVNINPDDQYPE